MKAPEKIYLYPYSTDGIYEVETKPLEGTIEYTHTDAFIEKAKNWLDEHICDYECEPMGEYPRLAMLDDFETYMKGE